MMTVEQKRRESFESWAAKHNESIKEGDIDGPEAIRLDRQGGVYIWANAESAWFAFNAALDAVLIELPLRYILDKYDSDKAWARADTYNACLDDVVTAIESTGLGLKVKP